MKKIGIVVSVNSSQYREKIKRKVGRGYLEQGYGLREDGHVGDWHRQVSLLSLSSLDHLSDENRKLAEEDFVENITIEGEQLSDLPEDTVIRVGGSWLRITQVGLPITRDYSEHTQRELVMHKDGVFAVVLESGWVQDGDPVYVKTT
ncbi:MOSC domain-containing protein [Clostridia bacterium]|nr:MOSC domain-containing protein [Clostridia bacterium]